MIYDAPNQSETSRLFAVILTPKMLAAELNVTVLAGIIIKTVNSTSKTKEVNKELVSKAEAKERYCYW